MREDLLGDCTSLMQGMRMRIYAIDFLRKGREQQRDVDPPGKIRPKVDAFVTRELHASA